MFPQELGRNEKTLKASRRRVTGVVAPMDPVPDCAGGDMTALTRLEPNRRTFLKQAAMGTAAVLAYPTARVLGANDRVRVGMIGVGDRGNDLLGQILSVHGVEVVVMADVYSRRRDQAKNRVPGIQTADDHRRLLDMKDIDAVIVASPLHIHAPHFLDTLAA